jgi:hypothetical protein
MYIVKTSGVVVWDEILENKYLNSFYFWIFTQCWDKLLYIITFFGEPG